MTAGRLVADVPAGTDWARVRTHSIEDAPPLPGRRPVLVESPGLGEPRTWGAEAAEDLASRGYVVVSIDSTGRGDHLLDGPAPAYPAMAFVASGSPAR